LYSSDSQMILNYFQSMYMLLCHCVCTSGLWCLSVYWYSFMQHVRGLLAPCCSINKRINKQKRAVAERSSQALHFYGVWRKNLTTGPSRNSKKNRVKQFLNPDRDVDQHQNRTVYCFWDNPPLKKFILLCRQLLELSTKCWIFAVPEWQKFIQKISRSGFTSRWLSKFTCSSNFLV